MRTSNLHRLLYFICLVIAGCNKINNTAPFTIQGIVRDCATGAPVANERVTMAFIDAFHNAFQNYYSYPSGSAVTDAGGHFSIKPELHSDATEFSLSVNDFNNYFEGGGYIYRDSIRSTIVDGSFNTVRKGWIVITFTNTNNPDTGDYFKVTDFSWQSQCAGNFSGPVSSTTPADSVMGAWKGLQVNGRAYSDAPRNDSIHLSFMKWKRFVTGSVVNINKTVFCGNVDTTYVHIDY